MTDVAKVRTLYISFSRVQHTTPTNTQGLHVSKIALYIYVGEIQHKDTRSTYI